MGVLEVIDRMYLKSLGFIAQLKLWHMSPGHRQKLNHCQPGLLVRELSWRYARWYSTV